MAKGRQGSRTPTDVREQIEHLALVRGMNAREIYDALAFSEYADRAPGLRTIQLIVARVTRPDLTGPWKVTTADPDELGHVLPVLADIMDLNPTVAGFSVAEAAMLVRLGRYAPELRSEWRFELARRFVAAADDPDQLALLTEFLAFRPWLDNGLRWVNYRPGRLGFLIQLTKAGK